MISTTYSFTATRPPTFSMMPPGVILDPIRKPPPTECVTGDAICQLVTDWQAKRFPGHGSALVEQKHDGVRAIWCRGPDGTELWSRNGAPMLCAAHCVPALRALESTFGCPMFFDAEYVEPGGYDVTLSSFNSGGRNRDPEAAPGVLMIFDAMPVNVHEGRTPCAPLIERKDALRLALAAAPSPFLRYVAHAVVTRAGDCERIAAMAFDAGHEGVVIKDSRAVYTRQRSATWQRIKRRLTADCEIVHVEPVPHADGTQAMLIVQHNGRRVKLWHGFNPEQRREMWGFWPRLVGRVVEVEAMEKTMAGGLRQPRFSKWKERA